MKAFDLETETRLRKLMWLSKTGNLEPSVEQTEFFTKCVKKNLKAYKKLQDEVHEKVMRSLNPLYGKKE